MHNCAYSLARRSLQGETAPAGLRSILRLQLLIVTVLALLWSGIQPVKANESNPFVDGPMLSALHSAYGQAAYLRGLRLNQLLKRLRTADVRTKLLDINRFFNRFNYRSDMALWNTRDYWATPLQFLGKHGGDCEDFVISKYFALRALGVSDTHLSMTYAKSTNNGAPHMVLSYYDSPGSVPLILDAQGTTIRPATEHKNLIPIYGFNETSKFLSKPTFVPGITLRADKIRDSKWDGLLSAIKESIKQRGARMHITGQSGPRFGS